jgi:hypothetical protein
VDGILTQIIACITTDDTMDDELNKKDLLAALLGDMSILIHEDDAIIGEAELSMAEPLDSFILNERRVHKITSAVNETFSEASKRHTDSMILRHNDNRLKNKLANYLINNAKSDSNLLTVREGTKKTKSLSGSTNSANALYSSDSLTALSGNDRNAIITEDRESHNLRNRVSNKVMSSSSSRMIHSHRSCKRRGYVGYI